MIKTVKYLNLIDVINKVEGTGYTVRDMYDIPYFSTILFGCDVEVDEDKQEIINTLFDEYILTNMFDEYIAKIYEDDNEIEKCESILCEMYYFIKSRYSRYAPIITKYEDIKEDLSDNIDTLVSKNITKVNDTPQNEGDFSGEQYTSNYVENTSTNDNINKKSNLDKLVDLQNKLEDTYILYLKEVFNRFIILERGE